MKKTISIITLAAMLFTTTSSQAKVGDVIGEALNTDIVAYINHYAVPSYRTTLLRNLPEWNEI